ncbi:ATP-binding cassette domain-containing protein [Actinoalloteichus hymeniacidonis]|uniref:ABC-type antimicrobial peptide transport system, ATPase component n=1 Tax=Actinoalloteichus hymeniacidonis TaxID=340345 RepID=A0AAC9HR38_9PSEU|nr:ATP-binding cassette domain-containing protein [Actinoalloteichus hymeniacidonis]AOS64077.1 ABC-type antimicrobial peptide transport system, ATPase component [Actinoalloteichus hymeniacidonis]MBB5907861.1 putative ABC transport system ATP-binding protein [Actinoalloteichus hymeniacidonis]
MMENASSASQPRNGRKPAYLTGPPADSRLLDVTARDVDRQPAAVNPDPAAALELVQVGKIHLDGDAAVCAVEDVSLRCPTGTWTVIVGPARSGRSSLLRCAAGLDRVTSGRVLLGGVDVTETSGVDRRGHVGLVSSVAEFAGSPTVEHYLRRPAPEVGAASDRLVTALLAHVGLEGRRDVAPSALSVEEQRCIVLLGALTRRPAVLIADEPTVEMGADLAEAAMSLLEQWVVAAGLTVLMASEELSGVRSADTACFLAAGRIVDSCSLGPRAVFETTGKSWSELCR